MSATHSLPLVDLARFRDPAADRAAFLAELRHAAHDLGFFYVVGHGVPAAGAMSRLRGAMRSSALADPSPLTPAERAARSGLANRQLTIR